ncbi:MAG: DMT family transporter, partial [Halieaceae bacterium]|nr:DMT family transporter [Halieaceae bacterium]
MARELTASQKAYLFGLITVVLWSTIATALKLTLRHIDQYQMLFVATLTSTLFLGTVLAFQRRLIDTLRGLGEYWRLSLAQGVLNPLVYYLILFSAYDLLPAQVAQPINYTWAITLMLLSVLILKQRPTRADYISAMICYSGVLVISLQGGSGGFSIANPVGVALALLSTIIWALYWILNMRDQRDSLVTLFSGFLFSLPLVILVTVLLSSIEALPFEGIVGGVY